MTFSACFLGFGEAGQTFASDARWQGAATGFDIKIDDPAHRAAKLTDFERCGVSACEQIGAAAQAPVVLSLVTADQSHSVAIQASDVLTNGTLFIDMNSVAPDRKRASADAVVGSGGRYVDAAVMAPVNPAGLGVPVLLSGPDADAGEAALRELGFTNVRVVGDTVGQASAIKMIRSVMIKGIEALTAECILAADRAGVSGEVLGSLGGEWAERVNYNLDRMLVHGLRRAAEMEEVHATLEGLGVPSFMTRSTVIHQRALGRLGLNPPPPTLEEKLEAISRKRKANAA